MSQKTRAAIRARFLKVDTSNVADVLDEMGLLHQGLAADFRSFSGKSGKLAGFAYTIRGQSTPYGMGGDTEKMAACQGISEDEISVWSGDGDGTCYFGELIALGLKERGCVGALADGGVRDIAWLNQHDFPVFARYRSPVQSIGRWKVNAWQIPVFIRGATSKHVEVAPGDFILADADGAIAIPAEHIETVLEKAEALTAGEINIRRELANGMTLSDALKTYGHV